MVSLRQFFLWEERLDEIASDGYSTEVYSYAVPLDEPKGSDAIAHLDSLEHMGVAPREAARIMIDKYGWAPVGVNEHQDPTAAVDKGASIWSDPSQPADVRKYSSCGGNLHIDLSEADAPKEDFKAFLDRLANKPADAPADIELTPIELHPSDAWGFDDPSKHAEFGEAPPPDPAWERARGGMGWDDFKTKYPKEAEALRSNVIDDETLRGAAFQVRPETDEKSAFMAVQLPGGRKLFYIPDTRPRPSTRGEELYAQEDAPGRWVSDEDDDKDDPGPEYDEPVGF